MSKNATTIYLEARADFVRIQDETEKAVAELLEETSKLAKGGWKTVTLSNYDGLVPERTLLNRPSINVSGFPSMLRIAEKINEWDRAKAKAIGTYSDIPENLKSGLNSLPE